MIDKTEAQPEALRLAAEFEDCIRIDAIPSINDVKKSAAELRRQHAEIQQLKAQLSARQAAPDGWRLVPVASTAAMEWAFRSAEVRYSNGAGRMLPMDPHSAFKAQYREMLSAAPPPPEREPLTDEQILRLFIEMYGQDPVDITEFAEVCGRVEKHHGIGATND